MLAAAVERLGAAGNPALRHRACRRADAEFQSDDHRDRIRRARGRFRARLPVGGYSGSPWLRGRAVREVLRAAALLGTDFAVRDLGIVLGRSVANLIPGVDEACAAGVRPSPATASGSGIR